VNPFPKIGHIKSLLIANRGEIAIRVMRAAAELGLRTVAIHSREDRFSLHRTKSDESYLVGDGKGPIEAYLDIPDIIRIATEARVDAVHPGYGFLSESPEFAEACAAADLIFVGPLPDTMRRLGNKVAARNLAVSAGVAVMPATPPLPLDEARVLAMAHEVGFPVMLKASWGGGGRGMRIVEDDRELLQTVAAARREAKAAFARTRSTWRSWFGARATSRCRFSATRTATWCICSSAIARCSGAIRRWSSVPRRYS